MASRWDGQRSLGENMSTAGFAMLATMPLVELGTELFPVLEGRPGISIYHIYTVCTYVHAYVPPYIHIYHSLQAFTLVQPTSTTPWISLFVHHYALGAVRGLCGV